MGFFHLHRASSSSASSALSPSPCSTPRTSTDSASDYMAATMKPPAPRTSLEDLPFELLQHVASYLDDFSAAKFCLSSRRICFATGTHRLASYLASAPSRIDARQRLTETVERALPGAWLCAWCDAFHPWSASDSPTRPSSLPCAHYNSALASPPYTLQYAHLRLALAAHAHGPAHGLPLSALTHSSSAPATLFRTPVPTTTSHTPRIANARLYLHSSTALTLPPWAAASPRLAHALFPLLSPALTQHRASHSHTGLLAALDNVVRRGWSVGTRGCGECASDWSVESVRVPGGVRVVVSVWRDLGQGEGPFEGGWRAHGGWIAGVEGGKGGVVEGSVRAAFEGAGEGEGGDEEVGEGVWERLAYSWQLERRREEAREREVEWRAIWREDAETTGTQKRRNAETQKRRNAESQTPQTPQTPQIPQTPQTILQERIKSPGRTRQERRRQRRQQRYPPQQIFPAADLDPSSTVLDDISTV
ncbi:hypothetical protein C7974DRAFT_444158 [Boeremia exigua]|uniref:uncharacterized protein n=1 Tax=Boeremia exigua TaxID=749465 RepID=UPI001E8C9E1B|nr:uncharacterized protein C7974DRAFT_444158 [Boeremia exigua]KAH6614164.1 hypothetical protein C7974DRAFT_444158 [Boeremia exigua]